jgi:hypothetical protein
MSGDAQWTTESEANWIMIPTDTADRIRKQKEQARIRRARYESAHPKRKHGARSGTPRPKLIDREFVVWDGEGPKDAGYALLGNSLGDEICAPYLRTRDCLDHILRCEESNPDSIHVGFGFNYDVSNILRELPWRNLAALHTHGGTIWGEYELEHIPHKWFKVKRGNVVAKIYDIRSFFAGGLTSVLEEWEIGPWKDSKSTPASVADSNPISTPARPDSETHKVTHVPTMAEMSSMSERQMVTTFKRLRSEFLWKDIDQIKTYMRLELKYTKALMERVRTVFNDAGYLPTSWHGPGALARMAFTRHKVYDAMCVTPPDVQIAARAAFAGGRFELVRAGLFTERIYVADQNSAYPFFATLVPNLNRGKWRRGRNYEPGKFAIYRIRYQSTPDPFRVYPLFQRGNDGSVSWPYRTEGWYWAPEAALVATDPDAEFLEALIFDEDNVNDRPFAFLREYYRRRQFLKRLGNPAEYTFKLIINSIYGQLAQRTGWDKKQWKAPRSHQLEWAGFITSGCRAESYRVALACGDKLISIDTDGVSASCPIPIPAHECGEELGQWKLDEYQEGIFWQSGIYSLKTSTGWTKAKTRGIPKGSYTAEQLIECIRTGEPLRLEKKVFITYGLAGNGRRDDLNTWQTEPHEFVLGGGGKRVHNTRRCNKICDGQIHRLGMLNVLYGPDSNPESRPHYLPWLDRTDRLFAEFKRELDDWTWYDQNHLDPDDEWVRSYT